MIDQHHLSSFSNAQQNQFPTKQNLINQISPKKVAFSPISHNIPVESKIERNKFEDTEKARTKQMVERANLSRKLGRYVAEIGQVRV